MSHPSSGDDNEEFSWVDWMERQVTMALASAQCNCCHLLRLAQVRFRRLEKALDANEPLEVVAAWGALTRQSVTDARQMDHTCQSQPDQHRVRPSGQ